MCKWSDPFSKSVLIDRGLDHNSLETLKSQRKNVSSDYSVLKARPSKKHWTKYNLSLIHISEPTRPRLISPKSPHRRGGLAPRCRLIASWGCIRSQGFGCSPIKAVRELGSERRETVRSLSVVGEGYLKGAVPSTRGPGWTHLWCTSCHASGTAGQLSAERINAEGI